MKKLVFIAKQPHNLTINFLILKTHGNKATSPSMNPPSVYVIAVFTSVLHCALNTPELHPWEGFVCLSVFVSIPSVAGKGNEGQRHISCHCWEALLSIAG